MYPVAVVVFCDCPSWGVKLNNCISEFSKPFFNGNGVKLHARAVAVEQNTRRYTQTAVPTDRTITRKPITCSHVLHFRYKGGQLILTALQGGQAEQESKQ